MLRASILVVGHLFKPSSLSVDIQREVGHPCIDASTVPVHLSRLNRNNPSSLDFLDGSSLSLEPTPPIRDDEKLRPRVAMPCCTRTGLESDPIRVDGRTGADPDHANQGSLPREVGRIKILNVASGQVEHVHL